MGVLAVHVDPNGLNKERRLGHDMRGDFLPTGFEANGPWDCGTDAGGEIGQNAKGV
jgi:hypothetical protein